MFRAEHPEIMWGLGLDQQTAALVGESAGPGFVLRNLPPDASAWMRATPGQSQMAWIPQSVWAAMPNSRRNACREVDALCRVLILDATAEPPETEDVLGQGFLTAVRAPLTRYKVRDVLLRVRELDALSADLRRKNDEILLERELLSRKSRHLGLLNRMLARASASLDVATILVKAKADLRHLLPVETLCAVLFTHAESGAGLDAEIHLHCRMDPAAGEAWLATLIAEAERLGGAPVVEHRQVCLNSGAQMHAAPGPDAGRLLLLPLSAGGETFGSLALLTRKGLRLAKDEVQTLNAAVGHLSLALRNALLFRQMKSMADHDGLTRIANRRSFEERLEEEAQRHDRYEQPLSLILMDLDHFKDVNDTFGHQAGDLVLRGMAALLVESLRGSDFPARYGGEEFAVILPHTPCDHAARLAERIRERVADHDFGQRQGQPVRMTVSAGVAALAPGARGSELVSLADQALYLAKEEGRNRVVLAGPEAESGVRGLAEEVDAAGKSDDDEAEGKPREAGENTQQRETTRIKLRAGGAL